MRARIQDTISFLTCTTFTKLWNVLALYVTYHLSNLVGKPIDSAYPMTVSVEPTTACNLNCPECPSGLRSFTRKTGNLKSDFFRKMLDQIHHRLLYLIFYFQGEPFINPSFLEMVRYAKSKKIYTITSTNGHFLNDENCRKTIESGLDRLIISVDGTTQDVYQSYRKNGNLETVLEGTKNMIRWKKKLNSGSPYIIFQFLVVKPNEKQIPEIYDLAQKLGVNEVKLKTAQLYDYKNGNPLMPENEKYSRYKKNKDGTFELKTRIVNQCWKMWHSCVITWNGLVVPCCFDKDAMHKMGDLKSLDFKKVWYGDAYRDFRKTILTGRKNIDICNNCTEGCNVWA